MVNLNGDIGELRFTLEIKRADTGKTETVEMVGYLDPTKLVIKETEDGSDTQHSS